MKNLFKLDHPIWKTMSFLSDCMLLTLIWFFVSLPIITIGPSIVALLHVSKNINEKSGEGVVKEFLKCFFKRFKKTFPYGILFLSINLSLLLIGISAHRMLNTFLLFVVIFLIVITSCFFIYLFALLAYFDSNNLNRVAFYMSIRHVGWTLFLFMTTILTSFITIYIAPYVSFFSVGMIGCITMKIIVMLVKENHYQLLQKN